LRGHEKEVSNIDSISALAIAILLLMPVQAAMSQPAGAGPGAFPDIEGRTLSGRSFSVPDSLEHGLNLVVVAFQRGQQDSVNTWLETLRRLEGELDDFGFYEFPVLPEMNAVARWFIYNGMRRGITSEDGRRRTVTFHLDRPAFMRSLEIDNEESIRLYLLDRRGTILFESEGGWSDDKESKLIGALSR
jgi:hypothetical protein